MKEILDRHAARLTPEERRATWTTISGASAARPRAGSVRALPALAAVAAALVAVSVFVFVQRQVVPPVVPSPSGAARNLERIEARQAEPTPRVESGMTGRSTSPAEPTDPLADLARREAERAALASGTAREARPIRATVGGGRAVVLPNAPPRTAPAVARAGGPGTFGTIAGRVTAKGQPIPYANVVIPATRQGALADQNGFYAIAGVAAGEVEVRTFAIGYGAVTQKVAVRPGATSTVNFPLGEQKIVKQLESIEVSAQKRIDTKSSSTRQMISADDLREVVRVKAGIVAQGDALHFRGGPGGEVKFQFDGRPAPPVVPTTGGTKLPNDEPFDSMFFRDHGVNPFIATDEDPLSTFAVDVDAASYTVTRRYLELGHLPPADAVRVEEFVNFFRQGYPRFQDEDFRILVDGAPSPFGQGYQLLRIGIKGREVGERDRKPARLTFVIDVSGSMQREDRLELVKRALRLLVDQLRESDRVGIVVYGTQGRVLLEPVALGQHADDRADQAQAWGAGRQRILSAIEALRPEGSTNAEEGLRLGYQMARRAYRPGAINRIVLCSDGVANVGRTGPESILGEVRSQADRGIHLTTIGFGMGNYNDVLMEQLADKGDGNHYYVDDLDEAQRVLVENLTGTLQTIAKDAKVQVEFDSTRVLRYRLLGFENRDVADRDFRNDRVDAGEIGAGHEVTALYEVKLARGAAPGRLATVRFRWARPEHEAGGAPQVREIHQRFAVGDLGRRFEDAAPRFRLDAAVAEFAEILRGSYWARESRLSDVLAVARSAARSLHDDNADQFVTLIERAAKLSERAKPAGEER